MSRHTNRRGVMGNWSFRLPESPGLSRAGPLRRIGARVATALRLVASRRSSSCKVSSPSLGRSRSYSEALDSHRAEAVEDCIEFLNSFSTSLPRSSSVSERM
ncbi:hypothetical protein NMG60_11005306 [Bertholletia excelsa]